MKRAACLSLAWGIIFCVITSNVYSQKKPLDHSVYDSWQHFGEQLISNDGNWIVYSIDPQEGDNTLVVQNAATASKIEIPRGYSAMITDDSRYLVFKIKPPYKDTRDARIKKKKPEDMPKDSLGILKLGQNDIYKKARVKSYKVPQKGSGWIAFHLEKPIVVKNLDKGDEKIFNNVLEYLWDKHGNKLLLEQAKNFKDSTSKPGLSLFNLKQNQVLPLSKGGNDFKNFSFSEDGR